MKKTKIALSVLLLIAVTLGALYSYFLYAAKPAAPTLSASLQHAQIEVGNRQRDYAYYLPAKLPAKAPLLFVLHGSLQTLDDMRTFSAYQFERLADEHGFILVYPQGVERNWNDCRAVADYPARQQNVDDVGLCEQLLDKHLLAAVPGTAFAIPGFVRLSYAAAMADLKKAVDRLRAYATAP